MGKRSKAGTSLRQKKRVAETYKELEEAQIEQSDQQRVQSKADDELFVLDTNRNETAASLRAAARAKNEKDASSKKRKYEPSEKDKRQVKKMLEVHGGKGAIALAQKGKAKLEQKRIVKRMAGMAKAGKPTFDLWDEAASSNNNAAAVAGKKRTKMVAVPVGKPAPGGTNPVALVPKDTPLPTSSVDSAFEAPAQLAPKLSNRQLKARRHAQATAKRQLAVDLPIPGQSYHPDREQHQEAIGEALSIEIRRNEAEEYKSRPISEGMSAFTKEFIMGESDSEEESSDEEEDEETVGTAKLIKKKNKLTRAQRNKQKRVKAEATALKERKLRKQFMHQINEVHIHNKAVKKSEKEHAERQLELAKLRREKRAQPLGKDVWNSVSQKDPIRAPSLPVALTEELQGNAGGNGGLRTVTPKGSLVTDRLESMVSRNMIQKKKADGRRIVQGKRSPNLGEPKERNICWCNRSVIILYLEKLPSFIITSIKSYITLKPIVISIFVIIVAVKCTLEKSLFLFKHVLLLLGFLLFTMNSGINLLLLTLQSNLLLHIHLFYLAHNLCFCIIVKLVPLFRRKISFL